MKKFTSILCALALVLSVTAAPVKVEKMTTSSKTEKVLKADFAKPQVNAAKQVKKADLAKAEKQQKADFTKGPKTNEIKHVRKAKLTTTNVEIQGLNIEYDDEDGTCTYVLAGPDRYFIFIFASEGTDPVVDGKTYTLDDMSDAYWYAGYYDWLDFESCSFTKTTVGGKIKITATATDEEGDVWNLSYDESNVPDCPAGGTFVADKVSSEYYAYFSDIVYELTVSESRLVFDFDILLPDTATDVESGKTYTLDDLDPEYSYIEFNKVTDIDLQSVSFTKTVAADGSYTLAIKIVDVNDNTWNLSATKAAPVVRDSTLTLNGTYEEGSYFSQIEAANADSSQYLSLILIGTLEAGDLDFEDLYYPTVRLVDGEDYVIYDLTEGELKVTYDSEKNEYAIKGKALGVNEDDDLDYINFTLNLTIAGPTPIEPTRKEELTISGLGLNILTGAWQIAGFNEDSTKYITLAAYSSEVAGTYTEHDLASDYSYVVTDISGAAYNFFSIVEANLTVTFNEKDSTATVKGTLIGENGDDIPEFTLHLSAKIPAPSPYLDYDEQDADFNENFETYEVSDKYLAKYGDLIVTASNANNARVGLDLYIPEGESTLTPGVYEASDSESPMTLYPGSCDGSSVYYSFVGYTNEEGIVNMWFPVEGTVTVDEDGVITVDAHNSYGRSIKAVLGTKPQAINNTNAANKVAKRLVNGQLVIEKNGVQYNVVGAELK